MIMYIFYEFLKETYECYSIGQSSNISNAFSAASELSSSFPHLLQIPALQAHNTFCYLSFYSLRYYTVCKFFGEWNEGFKSSSC